MWVAVCAGVLAELQPASNISSATTTGTVIQRKFMFIPFSQAKPEQPRLRSRRRGRASAVAVRYDVVAQWFW